MTISSKQEARQVGAPHRRAVGSTEMTPAAHAQSCVRPVDVCTCLCKSVSVHLPVCTCINAGVRLHTHTWGTCARTQASVCALVPVHMCTRVVCIHPCAHTRFFVWTHTCAHGSGRVYACAHVCIRVHTRVHTHMHALECWPLGRCGAVVECPRPLGTMSSSDPEGRVLPASRSLHANLNSVLDLLLDRASERSLWTSGRLSQRSPSVPMETRSVHRTVGGVWGAGGAPPERRAHSWQHRLSGCSVTVRCRARVQAVVMAGPGLPHTCSGELKANEQMDGMETTEFNDTAFGTDTSILHPYHGDRR